MNKIVLKIPYLEKVFGIKIKRNVVSIGLDTASKTGYAIAQTTDTSVKITIGFINIDVSKISDKEERDEIRYNTIYKTLKQLLKKEYITVIEQVYFGNNVHTLIILSRIGAIAWTLAKEIGCTNIIWKSAVQARKILGLKSNVKKLLVQQEFKEKIKINIDNEDIIDAIILALNGLAEK